jgi:tetratricopeptide (TPR) repeat protein
LFNQSISYDSRNAMSLMGLSDIYFDTGSSQKALLYAEKAVQAAPKNANYRIKLGDAYFKVLRYRDALDEYKKAKAYGSTKADDRIAKAEAKIGG